MAKRVWILGAGFSKPLGGPLLQDLLHLDVLDDLRRCYPDAQFGQLERAVLHTYTVGREAPDSPGGKRNFWSDAEQYLATLETAAADGPTSPAFRRISAIMHGGPHHLLAPSS